MSQRTRKRLRQVLLNEDGQMSIFVAMIFQVLFVFFAMVVNIGLLVHDKINLQNAVDLGAFYGAQRQAELLNEMAHINYQMRQDYKLLVWRYRVLGTLGREPFRPNVPALGAAGTIPGDSQPRIFTQTGQEEIPLFCVAHNWWNEFSLQTAQNENLCWHNPGNQIPQIPQVTIIAPWISVLFGAQAATQQAIATQANALAKAGPTNWALLMQMIYAYKQSVSIRKREIWTLREMLISDGDNFKDLGLNKIKDGVTKTVQYNLTAANRETLQLEFINGMAQGPCTGGSRPGEFAFPEIRTAPMMLYLNILGTGSFTYEARLHNQPPPGAGSVDPSGFYNNFMTEPNNPDTNPMHSSLGFEKNPWCMAYVGVKAKTRPHKPFAPFGTPIELTARAFAQPFGGRIGPWYMSTWPQNAPMSSGGVRVDPNTSARLIPGVSSVSGNDFVPNYSRFPGDPLGLRSPRAQGVSRHIMRNLANLPPGQRVSFADYYGVHRLHQNGDPLAWPADPATDSQPPLPRISELRKAEITAVAPDLFDVTYYSIDPRYYKAYSEQGIGTGLQRFANLGPPDLPNQPISAAFDIGSRKNHPSNLKEADVSAQVKLVANEGIDPDLKTSVYWLLRSPDHLLTAWAPDRVANYNFPTDRFGQCKQAAAESVMIPGGCAVGGRTGYSVRMISREHLLFDKWSIGGDGGPQGAILNPPPLDF
jgi:hypothetical protein